VGASDAPDCIAFKPAKPDVNRRMTVTASMRFTITNPAEHYIKRQGQDRAALEKSWDQYIALV